MRITWEEETYGTVGAPPHLLQVEFFDTGFVWSDSGAFNTDTVLDNGIGSVNRYLIIGLKLELRPKYYAMQSSVHT